MDGRFALGFEDRLDIEDLLLRFMRSFDDKDWDTMRSCLAETIDCDYSSFRGTPPAKIARDDYVAQRKAALAVLKTQHNLSNLSMTMRVEGIEVNCNYAILRFHPDFDGSPAKYFHSYGHYRFNVVRTAKVWSIASITQKLLVNEGNPALHGGLRK